MNILITTGIYPPDVGGPAKFVPLISKHLSNENEVRVITLSEDSKLNQDEKNQVYRIERNQNKIIRFLRTVLSIIKCLPFFLITPAFSSSATFLLVVSFGIPSAFAISTIFIFSISKWSV